MMYDERDRRPKKKTHTQSTLSRMTFSTRLTRSAHLHFGCRLHSVFEREVKVFVSLVPMFCLVQYSFRSSILCSILCYS